MPILLSLTTLNPEEGPALTNDIYDGFDPRALPAYSFAEAAHYLRIPVSTLRAWTLGHRGSAGRSAYGFAPVLRMPSPQTQLSFFNLIEAFVVDGLRRKHGVSMQRLRPAIEYLESITPNSDHPLAELPLSVFNDEVFVEHLGSLLNLSRGGQVAMKELIERYLRRVDRDPSGVSERLYPFIRRQDDLNAPRIVVIDPRISFGRAVISGTGIPTSVVAERFKAGETVEELAVDYARPPGEIQEAIRCELDLAA